MSPRKKNILNLSLILGTLLIVMIVVLSDKDIGKAWQALQGLSFRWGAAAVACYFLFVALDCISIWYFLLRQKQHISIPYSFYASFEGQFYSNITPGASGGQPMQIMYLHRRGIPVSAATSALVIRFFCFQAMLSVIGAFLWIRNEAFLAQNIGGSMWILIIGFIYNTGMVTGVLLIAANRRLVSWMVRSVVRLGVKMHIVRGNAEAKIASAEASVESFHTNIVQMLRRPLDFLVQLIIGGAQLIAIMTVIWCVYRGLGLAGESYEHLISLNVAEYLSAAYMPLPGASGAQEGVFSLYFGLVFPEGYMLAAMLLWRFFTYYGPMLLGAALTVISASFSSHGKKDNQTDNPQSTEE